MTGNAFYSDFDLAHADPVPRKDEEYRNDFQIERDRIIFSYPFRRLQSKTQVFQSGEYDFYRTRLTHSMEVAKIGRSICAYLDHSSPHLDADSRIDADLVEAIGLTHDLGHPPFGHIGERKLNELMHAFGGFEGNAQTLRIVTELIYERPAGYAGTNPTRAFVDGILKYKATQRECIRAGADGSRHYPDNHFIYDPQESIRHWVFGGLDHSAVLPDAAALNRLKSIECQIMDWADDTAYSLNDIVDGIHARYITLAGVQAWEARQESLTPAETSALRTLREVIERERFEPFFGSRIGHFVRACSLEPRDGFLADSTRRHRFDLRIAPAILEECALYKRIAFDLIFRSPRIQQIEYKGGYLLTRLFDALTEQYGNPGNRRLRLLSEHEEHLIDAMPDESGRYRRICDILASYTDGQAVRMYKRLFDPDPDSIAELG